jgi:hypothetical protein
MFFKFKKKNKHITRKFKDPNFPLTLHCFNKSTTFFHRNKNTNPCAYILKYYLDTSYHTKAGLIYVVDTQKRLVMAKEEIPAIATCVTGNTSNKFSESGGLKEA